jgi:hypothetical protein
MCRIGFSWYGKRGRYLRPRCFSSSGTAKQDPSYKSSWSNASVYLPALIIRRTSSRRIDSPLVSVGAALAIHARA